MRSSKHQSFIILAQCCFSVFCASFILATSSAISLDKTLWAISICMRKIDTMRTTTNNKGGKSVVVVGRTINSLQIKEKFSILIRYDKIKNEENTKDIYKFHWLCKRIFLRDNTKHNPDN